MRSVLFDIAVLSDRTIKNKANISILVLFNVFIVILIQKTRYCEMDLVLQNQYDSMDDSDLFPNRYRGWFQSGVYRQLMLFVFSVHLVFCAGSSKINFLFY